MSLVLLGCSLFPPCSWHREHELHCAAQRGVSRISGALSSTSVQSRAFQAPAYPEENIFFFTNPVSSDPNSGGFISIFISASIGLPEYLCGGPRSQVWCRGSCSCQRRVGKTDFSVQGLVKDESQKVPSPPPLLDWFVSKPET